MCPKYIDKLEISPILFYLLDEGGQRLPIVAVYENLISCAVNVQSKV